MKIIFIFDLEPIIEMQAIYTGYTSPAAPYRVRPSLSSAYACPPASFTTQASPFPTALPPAHAATEPALLTRPATTPSTGEQRIKAAAKALGFITPAILLARFAPGQSAKELQQVIPTDWKIWAKMLLGVASLGELNKALQWTPPPWLGAMMNVLLITPLISGAKGLRLLPVLLPTVGGLVQGTHIASEKAEKPLEENWNVPPIVTRLLFSAIGMGAGFVALPRLLGALKGTWLMPESQMGMGTTSSVISTCSRGCCSSAVCLNEIADYGAAFSGWLQGKLPGKPSQDQKKWGTP